MTTFYLRQNRAGHWDLLATSGPPLATFASRDEAFAYALDLAAIRTSALRIVLEFEQPGKYAGPPAGAFGCHFEQKQRLLG